MTQHCSHSSYPWLSSMDIAQALLHPQAWLHEMRFSRDCSSLHASPLGLASVQGLLARQLIPMNHEECSPGHHLSVPPRGLEHRLGTSSPDTTQDPPADARGLQISAVLHPTLSMGCRVWFCLRPCSENFTRKKQLQLKESQLQISVMSD